MKKIILTFLITICLLIITNNEALAGNITFTFGGSSTGSYIVDGMSYSVGQHTINLSVGTHTITCTPDNSGYHAGFVKMSVNGTNPLKWPKTNVNGNTYSWNLEVLNDNEGYATLNIIKDEEHPDLPAAASRTSGVAPLYVFFNANLKSQSATEHSFSDIMYHWDFGDPTSGSWGTDGKSRNEDYGPVAAHVFENPGTYTVTYTGTDTDGNQVESGSFTITVDDPDVVFAGNKTTCVSDTAHNDFSGCPAGAAHLTTDNLNDVVAYSGAGKRLLFNRGSSWVITSTIPFSNNNTGPFRIGAYGVCSSQTSQGICNNAPLINITAPNTKFLYLDRMSDWAIQDIAGQGVQGSTSSSALIGGLGRDDNNILLLRLTAIDFDTTPIGWTHWRDKDSQTLKNNAVVSCYVNNIGNMDYYIGGESVAFMGNVGLKSALTHVARVWRAYKGVITHNKLSGSSVESTSGRHALKLHGPRTLTGTSGAAEIGTYTETGGQGAPTSTQFVVVANNIFGSSGPWPVSIGPADNGSDDRLNDIIFENNKIIADYGQQSSRPVQVSLMFEGHYMSIRNNIIDGSGGANGYTGISVARRGVEPTPLGNRVYNNTIYRSDSSPNGVTGISVDASATDTVIRNNYVSFPVESSQALVQDNSGNAVVSNNILTNTPGFVNPDSADPLKRNFALVPTSPAIDQGYTVPVRLDFSGTIRPQGISWDVGAYEYQEIINPRSDVNQDNQVNTTDALLTLRKSLGLDMSNTNWNNSSAETGDVNCNNSVTTADALLLLRQSVGLDMGNTEWCGG